MFCDSQHQQSCEVMHSSPLPPSQLTKRQQSSVWKHLWGKNWNIRNIFHNNKATIWNLHGMNTVSNLLKFFLTFQVLQAQRADKLRLHVCHSSSQTIAQIASVAKYSFVVCVCWQWHAALGAGGGGHVICQTPAELVTGCRAKGIQRGAGLLGSLGKNGMKERN